jgi:hypothetical protein
VSVNVTLWRDKDDTFDGCTLYVADLRANGRHHCLFSGPLSELVDSEHWNALVVEHAKKSLAREGRD